jgi:hypothetical protein
VVLNGDKLIIMEVFALLCFPSSHLFFDKLMKKFSRFVVLVCLVAFVLGCGGSSEPSAPSGNELKDYLAEHPEIDANPEPEDSSRE